MQPEGRMKASRAGRPLTPPCSLLHKPPALTRCAGRSHSPAPMRPELSGRNSLHPDPSSAHLKTREQTEHLGPWAEGRAHQAQRRPSEGYSR